MIDLMRNVALKEVPGYNGLYLVTNYGNVYNTKSKSYLKSFRPVKGDRPGYKGPERIQLCFNGVVTRYRVDELIAFVFNSMPAGQLSFIPTKN